MHKRLQAIVVALNANQLFASMGRVTYSDAVRLALAHGLDILEVEYGPGEAQVKP